MQCSTLQPGRRKVVYLSGTRADFGLMRSTLQQAAQRLDLSLAVTGMHLEPAFGHTIDEILASGLPICGEVPVDVQTRTSASMAGAVGACLQGMAALLERERPDMLLLLGDRGEMLAGAIAALHLGIACVHLHGGERSGTVDEPVRHAISKLASYHLVATQNSRERLVRMGELPERIFVTGAPGLDDLESMVHMPAADCRARLGILGEGPFVLALFHPVVQQAGDAYMQTAALLDALRQRSLPVVWLEPNADAGSHDVLRALNEFPLPPGSCRWPHLPRPLFLAALAHAAVLVGNSSAGIIEAASFGIPVVNIGDRQHLRERNANVVDVPPATHSILAALRAALQAGHMPCDNLYGDGHAGGRIVELLASLPLNAELLSKANTY